MAHYKDKVRVDVFGSEIRLRRDKKHRASLTKGFHISTPPNPDPKGKAPSELWLLDTFGYHWLVRRRKIRASRKRHERKSYLLKQERLAFKEEDL